jgi:hypothetical protein
MGAKRVSQMTWRAVLLLTPQMSEELSWGMEPWAVIMNLIQQVRW